VRRVILAAILVAVSSPALAQVHVDAGALTDRVSAVIAQELPDVELTRDLASSRVAVVIARDLPDLAVRVTMTGGRALLDRRVSLERGVEPALRVALLLIVEAIEQAPARRTPVVATTTVAQPAPEPGVGLALAAWGHAVWWGTPSVPQLGASLSASIVLDAVMVSVGVAFAGPPCCALSGAVLDGDALEISGQLVASYQLLSTGIFGLRGRAGVGLAYERADVVAQFPGGASVPQVHEAIDPYAEVGAELGLAALSGLDVVLAGGVRARFARLRVILPAGDDNLDAGLIVPWLQLGVRVKIF